MFSFKSFCDLSVCVPNVRELQELCERYVELGYKVIAVNQLIEEPQFVPTKRRTAGDEQNFGIPDPVDLSDLKRKFRGKLQILNRLTFSFSFEMQAHRLLSLPVIKKYDLLGAIPNSQSAFKMVCKDLNVDIITFNCNEMYDHKLDRKKYNLITRRGLHFELMYSPAIMKSSSRIRIISVGHVFHYAGKSKNVIVTSCAQNKVHIKCPYDVICIGLLFGLSEEQSKYAISGASKKVLAHSISRKLGKICPILAQPSTSEESEEVELHSKRVCL